MVNSTVDYCTMYMYISLNNVCTLISSVEAAADQCHDIQVLQTRNIISYTCITDTDSLVCVCS